MSQQLCDCYGLSKQLPSPVWKLHFKHPKRVGIETLLTARCSLQMVCLGILVQLQINCCVFHVDSLGHWYEKKLLE